MCALASVCVYDDLTACKTCVSVRTSDHELAGRVDVENELSVEEGCGLGRELADHLRDQYVPDIGFDLVVHGLFACEFIVLGRYYDCMDSDRFVGFAVVFDSELGLGVRPEIWHQFEPVLADVRKGEKCKMRQRERERHVILGIPACVAEHHSLVAGALILRIFAHYALVDISALVVDRG